jgi:hypothetical protein
MYTNTLPQRLFTAQGETLTVSGTSGLINTANISNGIILATVTAASGTTPTLTFYFEIVDDFGNTYVIAEASGAQVITTGPVTLALPFGQQAGYTLGASGKVGWLVSGTNPSFTGVDIQVIGR